MIKGEVWSDGYLVMEASNVTYRHGRGSFELRRTYHDIESKYEMMIYSGRDFRFDLFFEEKGIQTKIENCWLDGDITDNRKFCSTLTFRFSNNPVCR